MCICAVCVWGHMYHDVHVEVRGEAVQLLLSFHLYMASKIELRSPGLVRKYFINYCLAGPHC